MIRTLIVDDEPLGRRVLRSHLAAEPDVEVVGEAEDGPSSVRLIVGERPDLVFLDIQMPGMDGFEVLSRVAAVHLPVLVFVTAHDEFALRAFEVHALDYLLKPFTPERFDAALERARHELGRGDERRSPAELARLLGSTATGSRPTLEAPDGTVRRFVVREGERFLLLPADEVDWIETSGNYVALHAAGRSFLVRETMNHLEQRLDRQLFARIHRRTIVNVARVGEIRPSVAGHEVVLRSGDVLAIGRHFRKALLPGGA